MTFVAFFIGSAVPFGILMGPMMCGNVGMFLILPISYGAIASAYEQVFGLAHAREVSNMPPPPPIFE